MQITKIGNFNFNNIGLFQKMKQAQVPFRKENGLSNDTFQKSISFQGFPCPPDKFKLKNLEHISCPSCGKEMLQEKEVRRFVYDVSTQRGEELVNTLKKYENLYRPIEKEAVNEIINMAEKFPEEDLSDLVKLAGTKHSIHLVKEQTKILTKIKGLGTNLKKAERLELTKYIDDGIKFAKETNNSNNDDHFGRKIFISGLYELTESFSNDKIVKDIRKTAQTLPSSTNSLSAFFVKYSREDVDKIAARLLAPAVVTTEHVKPSSLGGEDDTANYMVQCMDCNSKRGNMSYSEWFKIKPEMPQNLQTYINQMSKIIHLYDIKGYENYIPDIIATINKETKGRVKLEEQDGIYVPQDKQTDKKNESKEEKIERVTKEIEQYNAIFAKLNQKAKDFSEDPEYQNILTYLDLNKNLEEAKNEKIRKSSVLTNIHRERTKQLDRKQKLSKLQEEYWSISSDDTRKQEALDMKRRIVKLSEKVESAKDLEEDLKCAQEEYNQAYSAFEEAKAQFSEFRSHFKLPDDYIKEEEKLEDEIRKREEIESEIEELDKIASNKTKLSQEKGALLDTLEILQSENENRKQKIDFKDSDIKSAMTRYKKLKEQEDILLKRNITISQSTGQGAKGKNISYDFILDKALQKVQEELAQEEKSEIGQYMKGLYEIEKTKEEIINKAFLISDIPSTKKRRETLTRNLKQLNAERSLEDLRERLSYIMQKRESLQEKFEYANIEKEKEKVVKKINELSEILVSLLK